MDILTTLALTKFFSMHKSPLFIKLGSYFSTIAFKASTFSNLSSYFNKDAYPKTTILSYLVSNLLGNTFVSSTPINLTSCNNCFYVQT